MGKIWIQCLILLLSLLLGSRAAGLNVNLNQPITLRSDSVNITTAAYINDGPTTSHFYVAFEDSQLRAYVEDFSSFLEFDSNTKISKIKSFRTQFSISNLINVNTYLVSTLSDDSKTFTSY
jgi:hypothetical protein